MVVGPLNAPVASDLRRVQSSTERSPPFTVAAATIPRLPCLSTPTVPNEALKFGPEILPVWLTAQGDALAHSMSNQIMRLLVSAPCDPQSAAQGPVLSTP